MAATTVTRATITDDSGNGTSGTIINSAWVGTAIYDKIDALFSTLGEKRFEASGSGSMSVTVKNSAAGTANAAYFAVATNESDLAGFLVAYSSTYTTSGAAIASTVVARSQLSGGLLLAATHTSGPITFWSGNAERGKFTGGGHLVLLEQTTNPGTSDMTANAAVSFYSINNKLVFAYNNAGTVTYLSVPLNGSSTTWTHSTTAP